MTDPFHDRLVALRLVARLGAVHQDLLDTLLAEDAALTPMQRQRTCHVLAVIRSLHAKLIVLQGEEDAPP